MSREYTRGALIKMEEKFDRFFVILIFGIVSNIVLFMGIMSFVVLHDYVFIDLNNTIEGLVSDGTIPAMFSGIFEGFVNRSTQIIQAMDFIWAAAFISMIWSLGRFCYFAKRDDYYTMFGFLSFGVIIFLFVSSIYEQITQYLHTIFFDAILQNVTIQLNFFSFYVNHFTIINLIIVCGCTILNFVDLDTTAFSARKYKEAPSKDVGTTEL